jgi:methionine synthase I (cobalamin-dependent)
MSTDNLTFLDAVRRGVVVYDGAMGTQLQARNLTLEDFGGKEGANDYLVLTRPDVVREIHAAYFAAGADVVETNTFGGNRLKLDEYDLGHLTHELNKKAAELAREAAERYSTPERPRFVAGSIGPTGMLPSSDDPSLSRITFEELADLFQEQAEALMDGGCDVLLVETSQDILEVKAAVTGINRAFARQGRRVTLQVQVTLDTSGRMLLGTDVLAALATLEALPLDIIGLNCSTGPEHMREPIRLLAQHSRRPISVLPNAGLPLNIEGRAVYPAEPVPFADDLTAFVEDFGVAVVGGCCGTTPEHIRVLSERLSGRPHAPRSIEPLVSASSGMRQATLLQEPRPLLVGERVNSQGSRKVKQLLLAEDWDGLVEIARDALTRASENPDLLISVRGTQAGALLVQAPEIQAVGFTGSVSGGRFLVDHSVSRPTPITFYGELGSINPVVISPQAAATRGDEIGQGFIDSLMLGAGQFCTKPSVLIYPKDSSIIEVAQKALATLGPIPLLTTKIATAYRKRVQEMTGGNATNLVSDAPVEEEGAWVRPALFQTTVEEMLSENSPLREECFGPAAVVVPYSTEAEALQLSRLGGGVLVGCVHGEPNDPLAGEVIQALASRAGRVVWNGWPTGLAVAPAQMHGGPYPAATVPGATSVGLHAASRFARPVVFQSVPEAFRTT